MQHISFDNNEALEKECVAWLTANPTKGRIDWLCDTRCNPEEADMLRDFFKYCDNRDIKYDIPAALHISTTKDLPGWLCESDKAKGINADDIMVNFDFSIRNRFGTECFFDVAYNALYGASTLEEMVNEKVELIKRQLGVCHSAESRIDDVSWLFDRLLKQAGYYPAWDNLNIFKIAELIEIDNLVYNWIGTDKDGIPFATLEAITGDQADKNHIIVPENISFTWNDKSLTIPVKGFHERALKGLKAVSIIELPATIRLIAAEGFK